MKPEDRICDDCDSILVQLDGEWHCPECDSVSIARLVTEEGPDQDEFIL